MMRPSGAFSGSITSEWTTPRFTIYGALLWMGDKLKSDQHEHAWALWNAKGKQAFEADPETQPRADRIVPATRR
jgi:hypothetical protein